MDFTTLKPEFCFNNFIDLLTNANTSIALSCDAGSWYEDDVKYLYDNYCGGFYNGAFNKVLLTSGCNDDTKNAIIDIDFGDILFIDTIKLLNTNIKTGRIQISTDYVTWTTVSTISANAYSSIHWFASDYDSGYGTAYSYLSTSDGAIITDSLGNPINVSYFNSCRYVRITITSTILSNSEKYLGELYIGQRMFKLSTGKVLNYKKTIEDDSEADFKDYNNYRSIITNNPVFNADLTYKNLTSIENTYVTNFINTKQIAVFFPTPDYQFSNNSTINEVYLVICAGNFNQLIWGSDAEDVIQLYLRETKIGVI